MAFVFPLPPRPKTYQDVQLYSDVLFKSNRHQFCCPGVGCNMKGVLQVGSNGGKLVNGYRERRFRRYTHSNCPQGAARPTCSIGIPDFLMNMAMPLLEQAVRQDQLTGKSTYLGQRAKGELRWCAQALETLKAERCRVNPEQLANRLTRLSELGIVGREQEALTSGHLEGRADRRREGTLSPEPPSDEDVQQEENPPQQAIGNIEQRGLHSTSNRPTMPTEDMDFGDEIDEPTSPTNDRVFPSSTSSSSRNGLQDHHGAVTLNDTAPRRVEASPTTPAKPMYREVSCQADPNQGLSPTTPPRRRRRMNQARSKVIVRNRRGQAVKGRTGTGHASTFRALSGTVQLQSNDATTTQVVDSRLTANGTLDLQLRIALPNSSQTTSMPLPAALLPVTPSNIIINALSQPSNSAPVIAPDRIAQCHTLLRSLDSDLFEESEDISNLTLAYLNVHGLNEEKWRILFTSWKSISKKPRPILILAETWRQREFTQLLLTSGASKYIKAISPAPGDSREDERSSMYYDPNQMGSYGAGLLLLCPPELTTSLTIMTCSAYSITFTVSMNGNKDKTLRKTLFVHAVYLPPSMGRTLDGSMFETFFRPAVGLKPDLILGDVNVRFGTKGGAADNSSAGPAARLQVLETCLDSLGLELQVPEKSRLSGSQDVEAISRCDHVFVRKPVEADKHTLTARVTVREAGISTDHPLLRVQLGLQGK